MRLDTNIQTTKDLELEKLVLGIIIFEEAVYQQVADHFHLGLFTNPDHANVAKVIIGLKNDGKIVELQSVISSMKKAGYMREDFSAYSISTLSNNVGSTASIMQHTLILQELYMKREVIRIGTEAVQKANAFNADPFELIDDMEKGISNLISPILTAKIQTSEELFKEALLLNQYILDLKGKLVGISTGFRKIDDFTGGWQGSHFIVIAGATGMGKTALVLDFLLHAALSGVPVGMFSLEMPGIQLYRRLMAKVGGVNHDVLTMYGVQPEKMAQFSKDCAALQKAPIYFDDSDGLTILQFRNKARKMVKKHGVKLLIVDYLQLMVGEQKGTREQEIASITRGLKALSKELNVPVIALSQLSRDIAKRTNKEPELSDLRESGSIEQDADMVAFVFRPEYYDIFELDGVDLRGKAKFIIKKNRHGARGEIRLDFDGPTMRFASEGMMDRKPEIVIQEEQPF